MQILDGWMQKRNLFSTTRGGPAFQASSLVLYGVLLRKGREAAAAVFIAQGSCAKFSDLAPSPDTVPRKRYK